MASPRLPFTSPPPAVTGLGVVALLLAVIAFSAWTSGGDLRRELRIARADLEAAQARATELTEDLADLRRDLQSRQGRIEDLEDQVAALQEQVALSQGAAAEAQEAAAEAEEASAQSSEEAAAATDLARITTLLESTEDVTRAIRVTDVIDGNVIVGVDLLEVLRGGPRAGEAVQVRLALINAPRAGDCRHTQSTQLATSWLEGTGSEVLLRRPEGAPQHDPLGRQVAEVLAVANPASSLNVTMVVAGEAIIDEPSVEEDPALVERLRVAQASAQQGGAGVWGCTSSALLGTGDPPTPTPSPSASGVPPPTPGDG